MLQRLCTTLIFLCAMIGYTLAEPAWIKSPSLVYPSKYSDDFTHYDYVNPNAPKGGTLNRSQLGTFNTLNPFTITGNPAAGLQPFGSSLLYDSLLSQSMDESSVSHPFIATAIQYPDDYSWVKFRLNPDAYWHDGTPITADDVVWSFNVLKRQSPLYNRYYADVEKAEAEGDYEVTFSFIRSGNKELPHILGDLVVLPKHWWEGTDATGQKRDISRATMEIPLGSGPYRIQSFNPGHTITWERVDTYWAKDLPINVGRYNFDRIHFEYFLDSNAQWEAFKKGGLEDIHIESRMQRWMENYDFPAVQRGDVIQQTFPFHGIGRMQGFFINTRRDIFKDVRVREALTLAFDFEMLNRTMFYGKYKRIQSYFTGNALQTDGLPDEAQHAMLAEIRDNIEPQLYDTITQREYTLPVYDTAQSTRLYLQQAMDLLNQAGWHLRNNKLVNQDGQQMQLEILLDSPTFLRLSTPYIDNLQRLGIDASIRVVDAAQYTQRVNTFNYDMMVGVIAQTISPGNEQIDFFGSSSAQREGSRNYAGIENKAVDELIQRIIYADNRAEQEAAVHAMDRVLLWHYYAVPMWHMDDRNIAYWNKFGIPEHQPDAVGIDIYSWWIDDQKASLLKN